MAYDYLTPTIEKYKKNDTKNENTNVDNTVKTAGDWIGKGVENKTTYDPNKASTNYGTYEDDLKRLSDAQKQYQINQLKQARQTALDNLNAQEQTIKPTYQNQRNLATAQSQSGARSFAEYMANRGLTNTGASAQGEINRQSALQNTLGNIGTAEANAYRDIVNQRTQVENNYAYGLANANSAIEQEYLNNLLKHNEQQREYEKNLRLRALGQYANDYQAYMNTLDPNSIEYKEAAAARGDKVNNNYANAYMPSNSLERIKTGNFTINDALAAGFNSYEEAYKAYQYYDAIAQAQAEKEAEALAWDRYLDETKLNNSTRLTNAQVANYNSQIAHRNSSNSSSSLSNGKSNTVSYSTHKSILDQNAKSVDDVINYIDNQVNAGRMSETDAISLMDFYKINH